MDLTQLNEPQKQAAMQINGPVLILAGAGSGKTKTLTYRIAYMIKQGIPADNILAITFTNKAAKEMKERALNLIAGANTNGMVPTLSTFHSFCAKALKESCFLIGYKPRFNIFDADDSKKVIKDIIKENNYQIKAIDCIPMISSLKDKLIGPDNIPDDMVPTEVKSIYKKYQAYLMKCNAMDFDDLIFNMVKVLRMPNVQAYYQEKYKYLMVDEYQDVSHAQFEMIRLLSSKYRNICVVGDDYQSIYKFRGADITNILNFSKVFPDTKQFILGINYRSSETIVNSAKSVIAFNQNQIEKNLTANSKDMNPLVIKEFDNPNMEAAFITNDIKEKIAKGDVLSDFAILYRKNSMSRPIEDALGKTKLPCMIFGGFGFYQRAEIKDLLAYLKVIYLDDPDELSFFRIVNVPRRGIGKTVIEKMKDYADNNSTADTITNAYGFQAESGNKKVENFLSLIKEFKEKTKERKPSSILLSIIVETEYYKYLEDTVNDVDILKEKKENISELITKLQEYEDSYEGDDIISQFFEDIALLTDQDKIKGRDYISCMTFHRSKGLEYKNIYLIGVEEGIIPHTPLFMGENEEVEEERRLMYVGMTRAKVNLTISSCKTRCTYGNFESSSPSRFIEEINTTPQN